ncbi:MAG TPA: hypothetical protein VF801_08460 [Rhodocyclaceae bacterium]
MKHQQVMKIVAALCGLWTAVALAGNCEIVVSRDACPGNEALSYKKCDGKKACTESVAAPDAAACKKAAIAACEVFRPGITKSKSITSVKFDGTPVKPDGSDPDFCKSYPKRAAEYNKC